MRFLRYTESAVGLKHSEAVAWLMSRVVSFSLDEALAEELDRMVEALEYGNRSGLARDAIRAFLAERRTEMHTGEDPGQIVEGVIVLYFQHDAEKRLLAHRHDTDILVHSATHTCLADSHTCVDTLLVTGSHRAISEKVTTYQAIEGVDEARFLIAPQREDGCC
jgi:metal-responsive CopG/Arc/MetJ family transcriptional regulator